MWISPDSVEIWMATDIEDMQPLVQMELWDENGMVDLNIFTLDEIVALSRTTSDTLFYKQLILVKDLMETAGREFYHETNF